MIEIKDLTIQYDNTVVLKDTNIKIKHGLLTGISGPSGSGKTTLFYIIGLISKMKNYKYIFDGKDIDINNDHIKSMVRRYDIGFIFQDKNLHDYLTIKENLMLYGYISNQEYNESKMIELLNKVRLDISLNTLTSTLSGGQKQRLAIACALIKDPSIIVADEPTSALDSENEKVIIQLFKELASQGKMIIIASHRQEVIDACSIHYQIENKTVVTKSTVDNDGYHYQHTQKKLHRSFYEWYGRFQFGISKKAKIIRILLPSIIIAFCIGGVALKDGLINHYESSINAGEVNEIIVSNNEGIDIEKLSNLSGVDELYKSYSIRLVDLTINDKQEVIDTTYEVVSLLDYQQEQVKDYNKQGAYVSSTFASKYNILVGDKISFYDNKLYTYEVVGVIDKNIIQSEKQLSVYLHVDHFIDNGYSPDNKVVLTFSSFTDLVNISNSVSKIDDDYSVIVANNEYISYVKTIQSVESTIEQLTVILIIITIIMLSIIQIMAIMNQKYEIAVLKANGLSRRNIYALLTYISIRSILLCTVIINLLLILLHFISEGFNLPIMVFTQSQGSQSLFIVTIIYLIPSFIASFLLNRINIEKVLRF